MKKLTIVIVVAITLLTACKETAINGKLDGLWQVTEKENADGSIENMKEREIYYSVWRYLFSIRQVDGNEYLGRFEHTGDSLFLYEFRDAYDTGYLATEEDLSTYGLSDVVEHFAVETLTGNKMILKSKYSRLYLRKY